MLYVLREGNRDKKRLHSFGGSIARAKVSRKRQFARIQLLFRTESRPPRS